MVNQVRLVLGYELTRALRNPLWIVFGLLSPFLSLVLFSPLLVGLGIKADISMADTLRSYTPGVLFALALLGSMYVGFGLVADLRSGLLERLAAAPVSRTALILGRIARDCLALLAQSLVLVATAAVQGLRADVVGVALGIALMMLLSAAATAGSYCLALLLRTENALAAVLNFIVLPLQLLGGSILPLAFGPLWLQRLGRSLPSYWAVEGTRSLFAGAYTASTVPIAVACVGGLAVVLVLALRRLWTTRVT